MPGLPNLNKRFAHGEIKIMAGLQAGVIAAADVNSQPRQTGGMSLDSPATWSAIWFAVSVLYLLGLYYGMIRIRAHGDNL